MAVGEEVLAPTFDPTAAAVVWKAEGEEEGEEELEEVDLRRQLRGRSLEQNPPPLPTLIPTARDEVRASVFNTARGSQKSVGAEKDAGI